MTNADKIRNMPDEELFKFITSTMNVIDTCLICVHACCCCSYLYSCDEGVREC